MSKLKRAVMLVIPTLLLAVFAAGCAPTLRQINEVKVVKGKMYVGYHEGGSGSTNVIRCKVAEDGDGSVSGCKKIPVTFVEPQE